MDVEGCITFTWGMGKERVFTNGNKNKQFQELVVVVVLVVFGGSEHGVLVGN